MLPYVLKCPSVGHKRFEKSLNSITVGEAESPQQITKAIRSFNTTLDPIGIEHPPGQLQASDLAVAIPAFAHRRFIIHAIERNRQIFQHSTCWIYQFQDVNQATGETFVFGLFLTDANRNLIDYCVETRQAHKRRAVLQLLIRAICTPESVSRKFDH
jgi:hypothetical protein